MYKAVWFGLAHSTLLLLRPDDNREQVKRNLTSIFLKLFLTKIPKVSALQWVAGKASGRYINNCQFLYKKVFPELLILRDLGTIF